MTKLPMPREILPECKKGKHASCCEFMPPTPRGSFGPTVQCSCPCHVKQIRFEGPQQRLFSGKKPEKLHSVKDALALAEKKEKSKRARRKKKANASNKLPKSSARASEALQIRKNGQIMVLGEEDVDEDEYCRNLKKQRPLFRSRLKALMKKHAPKARKKKKGYSFAASHLRTFGVDE